MEIYVYGTGCGAGELVDTLLPADRITAFVDSSPSEDCFLGRPVISAETLAQRDYDLVIVTTRHAGAVAEHCFALGIDPDRLFYMKNAVCLTDRNRGSVHTARALLGDDFVDQLQNSRHLVRRPSWSEAELLPSEDLENDYVRIKTLEALCRELTGVPGAAAELGVYRGSFARCINTLLPERRLYLFDTFEGFDPAEAAG